MDVFDFILLCAFALKVKREDRESDEPLLTTLSGAVEVNAVTSMIDSWQEIDTDIVASAAISRARVFERGVVVNTTKYGIEEFRAKVKDSGSVT